jgi:hypothetical protein
MSEIINQLTIDKILKEFSEPAMFYENETTCKKHKHYLNFTNVRIVKQPCNKDWILASVEQTVVSYSIDSGVTETVVVQFQDDIMVGELS